MASQLSFRLATIFDNAGFVAFKREVGDMLKRMKETQTQTTSLQSAFRNLGQTLIGIFAVNEIRKFIEAAIEQERIVTTLANRFTLLGESGETAARQFVRLTEALSTQTRFSQTEQLQALNSILRTAKSSSEATKVLTLAQDVAAATGQSLASASFAIGRAQQGLARPLALITGLTSAQIREMSKQGTLLDELGKKFQGFAARDAATLGGSLDILSNKFQNAGQSIGEIFTPAVAAVVKEISKIDTPTTAGALAFGAFGTAVLGAQGASVLFGKQLEVILKGIGLRLAGATALAALSVGLFVKKIVELQDAVKIFREEELTAAQSSKDLVDALRRARGEAVDPFENVAQGIQKLRRELTEIDRIIAESPAERRKAFLEDRKIIADRLRGAELAQKAEQKFGESNFEELQKKNRELTQDKLNLQQLELLERRILASEILVLAEEGSERQKELLLEIANIDLQITRVSAQQKLDALKKTFDATKELLGLFERALKPIDVETATEDELQDRRDAILQRIKFTKAAIAEELAAELAAIDLAEKSGLDADEADKQRTLAKLKAQADLAETLREAQEELAPIEPKLEGVKTFAEEFDKKAAELERKVKLQTEVLIKFDDAEHLSRVERAVEDVLRRHGIISSRKTTAPQGKK